MTRRVVVLVACTAAAVALAASLPTLAADRKAGWAHGHSASYWHAWHRLAARGRDAFRAEAHRAHKRAVQFKSQLWASRATVKRLRLANTRLEKAASDQAAAANDPSVIPWPWDEIAECESGGDYRFGAPGNPNGDGYYQGAVNWAPSTWDAAKQLVAGAAGYPDAWDAPPSVQVRVAQAWLKRTDWGSQWPECSRRLGLS